MKEPFDIDRALQSVRDAVRPYAPAALFQLAEEGYASLFETVVGCIISVRTRDEDLIRIGRRLFARARTPDAVAALADAELLALIHGTSFAEAKTPQIAAIARIARERGGALPADYDFLLTLPGVGPKCANLALGVSTGDAPHVAVDVHVHRVTNRWGYVAAPTPEKTMAALDTALPAKYRVEINRLLVPFGKHVCTGPRPHCPDCPVLSMCRQVGVTRTAPPGTKEVGGDTDADTTSDPGQRRGQRPGHGLSEDGPHHGR